LKPADPAKYKRWQNDGYNIDDDGNAVFADGSTPKTNRPESNQEWWRTLKLRGHLGTVHFTPNRYACQFQRRSRDLQIFGSHQFERRFLR
jgi:hypothetical protein